MLKGLQVKAELSKLGVAPRAYSEYLLKDEADPEDTNMVDTSVYNNSKRLRMFERFAKIESARPALPQFAVNLTRKLQQLIPGSVKNLEQGKANARLEKRAI